MVTPSKKTNLIPLLSGASLLALQFVSDAKHQSNVERKIERATGDCYGKEQIKEAVVCLMERPVCNANNVGKTYLRRDGVVSEEWKAFTPGTAQGYIALFGTCPLGEYWECVRDNSTASGGRYKFLRAETVAQEYTYSIDLVGICTEDH